MSAVLTPTPAQIAESEARAARLRFDSEGAPHTAFGVLDALARDPNCGFSVSTKQLPPGMAEVQVSGEWLKVRFTRGQFGQDVATHIFTAGEWLPVADCLVRIVDAVNKELEQEEDPDKRDDYPARWA